MIKAKRLFPLVWVIFGFFYSIIMTSDNQFRLEIVGFYVGLFVPMWFALNIEWERIVGRGRTLSRSIIWMMLSVFFFLPSVILEVLDVGAAGLVSEILLGAGWSLIVIGSLAICVLAVEGQLHLVPDKAPDVQMT